MVFYGIRKVWKSVDLTFLTKNLPIYLCNKLFQRAEWSSLPLVGFVVPDVLKCRQMLNKVWLQV